MGGANNWRQNITGGDWMREMEKRILNEERRPLVRSASDLLGPGFGPYATQVLDWNSDEAKFNGTFFSVSGQSLNSPDNGKFWIGQVLAQQDGHGLQHVWEHKVDDPSSPYVAEYVRRFYAPGGMALVNYGPWVPMHPDAVDVGPLVTQSGNVRVVNMTFVDHRGSGTLSWQVEWIGSTVTGDTSGGITNQLVVSEIPVAYRPGIMSAMGTYSVNDTGFGAFRVTPAGRLELITLHANASIEAESVLTGTVPLSPLTT